ncbi:MAG: glycosyltransferase family 4 protein, partial [Nitrososphaeria archaeon]
MKILFICERFNGHSIKVQPWKHVFELAKGLQRRKHEICILTDKDSDLSNKELILAKFRIKSVRKGKFLFNMQDLNKVLSEDFDIINWHASSIISSLQFKHLKNIRQNFVWTLHSGIIDFDTLHNLKIADALLLTSLWSHFLSSLAPAFLLRNTASFPHMKAIITLSKRMKNYFIKFGINENIVHVIYSGVDVEKYHPRNERYTSKIKEE